MRKPALALLAVALCALVLPAAAQSTCANLTIVAPFPAGSNTDAIARLVGERAGEALRRPVIIDNKPGAEGQIAAVEIRRAAPDGCRILFATAGNISILPFLRREPPYDPLRDFTPIADIGRYNFFLFVSTAMPADVRGFVEAARARPGAFNFATANNTNLLAFAEMQRQFGLRVERVVYRGEPAAMTDLMQDRVQAMVATSIGVPYAREGRLRALAVMLPERSPLMPDVPTFTEAGIRDLGLVPWAGFLGPAGMAQPVVDALSQALVTAMERADVRDRAASLGFTMTPTRAAPFARLLREQHEVYGRIIREVGLPVE